MSEVKSFVDTSKVPASRGAKYLASSPRLQHSQSRWPIGSQAPAHGVAANQVSPPSLVAPFADQIRAVLKNYYRFIGQTPRRSLVDQQVQRLTGHYNDLKKIGFDVRDVTTFGLKHAKALLNKWQTGGCANNTVYSRWSVLRSWSRSLNKHGMLPALKELQPGFVRNANPSKISRHLTAAQIAERSDFLRSKPDLTVYLADRLCRELGCKREEVFQIDLDALLEVVEGEASVLRAGVGNQRAHIPHARLHLALLTEVCDFIRGRNRKTLAWPDLDLDAALQKYSLRLSYVTRTLFPDANAPAAAADGVDKKGGAA